MNQQEQRVAALVNARALNGPKGQGKYKGVQTLSYDRHYALCCNRTGPFRDSEEEAAKDYDKLALEEFGDICYQNGDHFNLRTGEYLWREERELLCLHDSI